MTQKTERKPRTRRTPIEAAAQNANNAITQLQSLGSKLFRLGRGDLMNNLQEALDMCETLHDDLLEEPVKEKATPRPEPNPLL